MPEQKPSRRVTVGIYRATLDGATITYTLKRGPRCRRARLEIARETGLIAVVPCRYDLKDLPAFLDANKRWIIHALKKYCNTPAPKPVILFPENTVPYLGVYLKLERDGDRLPPVRLENGRLAVSSGLFNGGQLAPAVLDWYRHEALRVIGNKTKEAAKRLGLSCRRIVLKDMRTRWGSCSTKGNLNFCWRLILMPEPIVDYVIIHELMHLRQMNHSDKFWALVEKECPDWREKRRWLTKNGREYAKALDRVLGE